MSTTPNQNHFALPLIHQILSVESILVFWFALTPIASFFIRFPFEKSLITFDRLIFTVVALLVFAKSFSSSRNPTYRATKFEIFWGLLSVAAIANALLQANNVGYSTKIAIDAFFLPLIAFHVARYHFKLTGYEDRLLLAAISLAFLLFATGIYEFATGSNLFAYRGSEIMRERELRINGAFASDSSFAIICLLLALFLRVAPRLLGVKFDKSAKLVYISSIIAVIFTTLLPFFRSSIAALVFCWVAIEILIHLNPNFSNRVSVYKFLSSHRLAIYAVIAIILAVSGATLLEMQSQSSVVRRLTSPRNLYARIATWQTAARIALERPVTGVGLANYSDYFDAKFSDIRQEEDLVEEVKAVNTPHSNFLWIASELGFVGLALYLFAYASLFLMGYRALKRASNREQALAGGFFLVLLIAYTIPGLTLSSGAYSDLNLYFFFLLGLVSIKFN